jgi:outer membrane protein TolC
MKARRSTSLGWMISVLLLAVAPGNSVSAQGGTGPTGDLTLPEAVRLALDKHPALRAAGYQAEAAAAGVDQARSGFLPRWIFLRDLPGAIIRCTPLALSQPGRFTQADFAVDRLNHPDPISNWRTNIGGSVPLPGGRTVLGYQQAQIGVQAAEQGRARVEQDVLFNVIRAYYGVLLAQEAKATVDTAVRTAEANLASAEARYEAGVVVASDTLAARVRLARLKEESIAAANHVRLGRAALNEAMGVSLDQSYRMTGRLDLPPLRDERLEGLEKLARQHRPDYRQVALEVERLEKEVLRAKGTLLPTLHLLGNYEINNQHFSSDGQDSWTVGVILNVNLFNGGADRARIVEAEANHQRIIALRERLGNTIGLEVRDAYLALQTARERVTVARDAVTQAEESLRIVQDRYDAGLTTIVELLDSETALTAARTNLTRALYDATVSQARLEFGLGDLDRARY